jgi:hypothetical protein
MAFVKTIEANQIDSHQTSPAYMLTFLRWAIKDTKNNGDQANFLKTKSPLVVISDCISLTVSSSKSSYIHQANMILMGGDVNYATAVAPGDFVFINMLDDEEYLFGPSAGPNNPESSSLYSRARNYKPINGEHDGFKGIFKVQSVKKLLQTAPDGRKTLHYQISAGAFTEFNQVIYFNPYITFTGEQGEKERAVAESFINAKNPIQWEQSTQAQNLGEVFKILVQFLIGEGWQGYVFENQSVAKNYNKNFLMPSNVAKLLGLATTPSKLTASDLFNYYIGIQQYNNNKNSSSMAQGLNPKYKPNKGHYFESENPPPGTSIIHAEAWAQVTAWSILNQYSNSLINEMFTAFKLTPNGKIMPCVVYRQKPFSSTKFINKNKNIKSTEFLSLPRWKIDPNVIYSISVGKDEVARINFVHVVTKSRHVSVQNAVSLQNSVPSARMDEQDVQRNGLRPLIASSDFDWSDFESYAVPWNKLVFDWVSNGHLKENGTVHTVGIQEPIAVGDNCQIENTVYHIESINHAMSITQNGQKRFETTLQLSYGVDESDSMVYTEMRHVRASDYQQNNWDKGFQTLPGLSDSQDVGSRVQGEESILPDAPDINDALENTSSKKII